MENFRKLQVWSKAHELVLATYKVTEVFPKSEMFCLVSQMRRAGISVVANIVEGSKRKTPKDRQHFLVMSETSLEELKYYFILSESLGYLNKVQVEELTAKAREVGRMLNGLYQSIN